MAQNQVTTLAARNKMVRARAGEIELPPISGFVFGDGGIDASGNVIPPQESDTGLASEILRREYETCSMQDETSCRYECTIGETELANAQISEIGLYDSDGDILVIKRFKRKEKDSDLSMSFWITDVF